MEDLKQIVKIIEKYNPALGVDLTAFGAKPGSKIAQLLAARSRGVLDSNEAAAKFLGLLPDSPQFRKCKSKLKNHLISCLLGLDFQQSDVGIYDKHYLNCWRQLSAVKILLNQGATVAGMSIARKLLKKALHFRLTEVIIPLVKIMRIFYSTRIPDARKLFYFDQLYQSYSRIAFAENLAEDAYTDLINQYRFMKKSKTELSSQAFSAYEQLQPYLHATQSDRLLRHAYLLQLFGYMFQNDYRQSIEVCNQALRDLSASALAAPQLINIFLYQKLACHTQLRQYEQGLEIAEYSLKLEQPGSPNWFKNRALAVVLSFHTQNYNQAYDIFGQAAEHPNFRVLNGEIMEQWKIIEAYLELLILTNNIRVAAPGHHTSFRLNKFLNEVPIFSKEKAGRNIPVLIVQILILIAKRRYEQAIAGIESLSKYRNRYLRRDDSFRTNCFIRMLQQIVVADFHRAGAIRRANKYLNHLQNMPLDVAQQDHEIEYIPYENLWEVVTATLRNRFYYQSQAKERRAHRQKE